MLTHAIGSGIHPGTGLGVSQSQRFEYLGLFFQTDIDRIRPADNLLIKLEKLMIKIYLNDELQGALAANYLKLHTVKLALQHFLSQLQAKIVLFCVTTPRQQEEWYALSVSFHGTHCSSVDSGTHVFRFATSRLERMFWPMCCPAPVLLPKSGNSTLPFFSRS